MKQVDNAFKLFQEKKYAEALSAFDALLEDSETPSWIKARARSFHAIASDKLSEECAPHTPALGDVSYYINLGDYQKAEEILNGLDVAEEHKAYLRAEMAIEQDNKEDAVKHLKEAIALNKRNVGYALNSPSFAPYLKDEELLFLRTKEEAPKNTEVAAPEVEEEEEAEAIL